MIYLLTAVGLSPGDSKHLHTNNTYNNTNNNRTIQITTNVEECGPCPVFASFTTAFALQLRKKNGKNLSQGKKNLSQFKKNLNQGTLYILPKHPHITKSTHTHIRPHITKPTRNIQAVTGRCQDGMGCLKSVNSVPFTLS